MRTSLLALAGVLVVWASAAHAEATFEFARFANQIPIGAKYMAGCVGDASLRWTEENTRQLNARGAAFKAVFRQELQSAGVGVQNSERDLFAAPGDHADFQVGALVTSLSREGCNSLTLGGIPLNKASQTYSMEWQIYSTAEGRIVARIQTQGVGRSSFRGDPADIIDKLSNDSFAANVQALLRSPEFQRLRLATLAATPSARQAFDNLTLSMPSAERPVALKDAVKAVVTIFAGDWLGSGVLVSPDGYLLTNYHVSGGSGRVRVRWPDGSETVGEVIRGDSRRDVALVKTTPPPTARPVPIRRKPAELGETVYAIGTPREREFAGTLTRGIVSAADRSLEGQRYIQSDVAVTHGNSGGPLLDERAAIIGLAQSVYEPDGVGQNINFFVPIEEALRSLAITPQVLAEVSSPGAVPAAPPARRTARPATNK